MNLQVTNSTTSDIEIKELIKMSVKDASLLGLRVFCYVKNNIVLQKKNYREKFKAQ